METNLNTNPDILSKNSDEKPKKAKKGLFDLEVIAGKGFLENFFHNYKKQLNSKAEISKDKNILKDSLNREEIKIPKIPNYQVIFNNHQKSTPELLKNVKLDLSRLGTTGLLKLNETEKTNNKIKMEKQPGFNINEIPLKQFERLGISQDTLIKSGLLEKLLKGEKTANMDNISLTGSNGKTYNYSANFQLKRMEDGSVGIDVTHKKQNLIEKIAEKAIGSELTPEMKQEIKESGVTKINNINNPKGDNLFAFILFNSLANKLQLLYPQKLTIPDQIKGITVTKDQQKDLKEGKSIRLEGMTAKDGSKFTADVNINPQKKSLTFTNPIAPRLEINELSKKNENKIEPKNDIRQTDKKNKGMRI